MISIEAQRELAARIAARAELRDLRLFSSNLELEDLPDGSRQLGYDLQIDADSEWDEGDSFFSVRCTYTLTLAQTPFPTTSESGADVEDNGGEPDRTPIASAAFTYRALFELLMREEDEPPSSAELKAYALTTGSFAVYPYAREYVRDVITRMGLPTLTLGVLRQPLFMEDAEQPATDADG